MHSHEVWRHHYLNKGQCIPVKYGDTVLQGSGTLVLPLHVGKDFISELVLFRETKLVRW